MTYHVLVKNKALMIISIHEKNNKPPQTPPGTTHLGKLHTTQKHYIAHCCVNHGSGNRCIAIQATRMLTPGNFVHQKNLVQNLLQKTGFGNSINMGQATPIQSHSNFQYHILMQ